MIYVRKIDPKNVSPEDHALISDWLSKDKEHQALGISPKQFFEPDTELAIIHDEDGPRMIVRFHKALRVAVQFNPDTPFKNAKIGREVTNWFKTLAKNMNAKEVITRPGGKAIRFVEKLGFKNFVGKFIGI
jgi:hypothetical protein